MSAIVYVADERRAMLTAYFDDSGSHGDTKALVVCGFVSSVEQWLHFENDWLDVLAMPQFDLEYLHIKELRAAKGRFAKFKGDHGLQRDLFDRLQRVLQVRIKRTFAGAVLLDDYDRLNLEYTISEVLGPPLVMAAQLAIAKLMAWREAMYEHNPIQIVVDQGIRHWGILDDRSMKVSAFTSSQQKRRTRPRCRARISLHGSVIAH